MTSAKQHLEPRMRKIPMHIGWREFVSLPDLGINSLKAKIDTGARTSALHATDIERFERDGMDWVSFFVPQAGLGRCSVPLLDTRAIKNTSGIPEKRLIIQTALVIGTRHWVIETSLANRERMGFDLILGRTAIRRRGVLVDPSRSFLAGDPESSS